MVQLFLGEHVHGGHFTATPQIVLSPQSVGPQTGLQHPNPAASFGSS